MKPQFLGVKGTASNIGRSIGSYTQEMFQSDFPQFMMNCGSSIAPNSILQNFIDDANKAIQPDKWFSKWRYACGLYVAHYLTLYLKTYAPSSSSPAEAAATGELTGVVKSATLGDASVSYDTSALTEATKEWGSLNATQYGQLLATEARLVGMGGTYAI